MVRKENIDLEKQNRKKACSQSRIHNVQETDLFLQTLTHSAIHIITRAKELQDIVLRVTQNKIYIGVVFFVYIKHAAKQEF